jgi:hypothetical protein
MRHSAEMNLIIEYLCKYEFIFKRALAHESGDPGVLFAKKTRRLKISLDCPFKIILNLQWTVVGRNRKFNLNSLNVP